jgi:hypothetical protein
MRYLKSNVTGIDQGSLVLFSDFEDGGLMWAGEGPRAVRKEVEFSGAFRSAPAVHISLSMWDMDQTTNFRADISTENITETGFTILFQTWADSRVARVRADWFAIGELPDDDDWDVG